MVRTGRRYRHGRAADRYDVIVIGSGIGGLATAALLSRLGKRVCVLEQHYTAGGYTHSYERNGYEWDVGIHYIGEMQRKTVMRRLFDAISDGSMEWAPMDAAFDRIILGDRKYDFVAGRENFRQDLKTWFPDEVEAIDQYIALVYEASRGVTKFFAGQSMPPWLAKIYNAARPWLLPDTFNQTTREVLSGLTKNEELIGVLTGQWGDYGLPPSESAFMMHAMVVKHYMNGGSYPVGGSWRIAESIIPVIRASGGEVFTYAGVKEIMIENNTATGVRMMNGDALHADQVVSNAGVLPTIHKLLPADTVKAHKLDQLSTAVKTSSGHLNLYAGFKGTAEELGLPKTNLWIYPSANHDLNVHLYRQNPSDAPLPLVYISFPSAKDPSWAARYPGKSTIEVVTVGDLKTFAKWEGSTWNDRGPDYDALKQRLTDQILEIVYKELPKLRAALDFCELSTPLSTQWFQWNMAGEIYGIDHTLKRFQQRWLHPKTPVKNLYLTGADVVTAGFGGALVGGYMAAINMAGRQAPKLIKMLKGDAPTLATPKQLAV